MGSLYIAPLAAPTEPQAQHIVRQQMQQQQQSPRDSPMRQLGAQNQSQQPNQQLRWMSSQPKQTDQPAWARPEENGNVVPSSLNRIKSPPPPPSTTFQSQPQAYQPPMYQPQPQPFNQGNGFGLGQIPVTQNFGAAHNAPAGLRLQINTKSVQNTNNNATNQSGPRVTRYYLYVIFGNIVYTFLFVNLAGTHNSHSIGTNSDIHASSTKFQYDSRCLWRRYYK